MKHLLKTIALSLALCCLAAPSLADMKVVINPKNTAATNGAVFEGWGTSLCWWANRLGYSDSLAQQSADLFFSMDGLGFNIMRYNIGGGDDPAHTHITRTDSIVPGWLILNEATGETAFDPTADARQLNVLTRAVRAAGEEAMVEVFSNSPPYFMTESGCSSGALKAKDNNLRSDCVEEFADYLARVTAYMKDEMDLPVVSLSPMNEPNTDYWQAMSWKQEGCHVDAGESQSRILEATHQKMLEYGVSDVVLAASDETSPQLAALALREYSDAAKKAVGRINTHTYSDKGANALQKLAEKENIPLWMSEVDGDGSVKGAGEMGAALWLGKKIISDIGKLKPGAWVLWQVVDSHISKEGMHGNRDTGMVDVNTGFWGTAVADHDNDTIVLTQKYYGLGQFTRYIRPGSTLISCGSDALAAYHPENGTLTVVLINAKGKENSAVIDLRKLASPGEHAQVIRTSGSMAQGEHWAQLENLAVEDGRIRTALAPCSITTLVVSGAAL